MFYTVSPAPHTPLRAYLALHRKPHSHSALLGVDIGSAAARRGPMALARGFWLGAGGLGSLASAIAYDRYRAHLLLSAFVDEARPFGLLPAPPHGPPRTLTLLLATPVREDALAALQLFKRFAAPLLTVAGVDYLWYLPPLEVNSEALIKAWNASPLTPPDLLIEGRILTPLDIQDHILAPALQRDFSHTPADQQPWLPVLPGRKFTTSTEFVALSQLARNCLLSTPSSVPVPAPVPELPAPASQSWLNWFRSAPAQAAPPPPVPKIASIAYIPCDQDQSFVARSWRFLFQQRRLTADICQQVMQIIRTEQHHCQT